MCQEGLGARSWERVRGQGSGDIKGRHSERSEESRCKGIETHDRDPSGPSLRSGFLGMTPPASQSACTALTALSAPTA